jgi:acyl-CoA hydrolase
MNSTIKPNRTLEMAEMMTPNMANFMGNVHGGQLMYLLDKVAYACAVRYAGSEMVTLSVDHILFKQPIYVNELVLFKASINFVGKTSLEVGIRVEAENLTTQTCRHTNTSFFTMVAMGKDGKPQIIKPFTPKTQTEKRRHKAALDRRANRLAMAKAREKRQNKADSSSSQ